MLDWKSASALLTVINDGRGFYERVCPQPASVRENWLLGENDHFPEGPKSREWLWIEFMTAFFSPVSEHFCWRDKANFSLFKAPIYSVSLGSAGEIVFLISHGHCSLSSS